jgi:uncharacterized membrane protein YfcA
MTETTVLLLIGLFSGLLGGLLGVGGSVVMIPAVTVFFGRDQHVYQAAAMIMNFFVALPAAVQHWRAGAVLMPVVRRMIPTSIIGVLIGVWLSSGWWFHGDYEIYLARLFGAFLLYEAAYNTVRLMTNKQFADIDAQAAERLPAGKIIWGIGLPMGVIAGLLGIGGGTLAVPLQQVFLKMPLRRAIANSSATIILLSCIGAVCKNYTNVQAGIPPAAALKIAACVIPTGIIGGMIGAHLTHRVHRKALRVAFICLLVYGGYELMRRRPRKPVISEAIAACTQLAAAMERVRS